MLDRKLLIRIHVRKSNISEGDPVYPVIKVIHDLEVIDKCTPVKAPIEGHGTSQEGNTSSLYAENLSNAVNLISDSDPQYSVDDLLGSIEAKTPGSAASTPMTVESPALTQPDKDGKLPSNRTKRVRVKKQKFMFEEDDI
ncbi:hypothetical protein PIB30_000067 [Stylosanthes scabra]|uniref:Uncharacterized protein n=1 Tax=Stylosanthes scabra TaxID=79078 RepID=A0ABU6Q3G2_9FABA|nr:hypothetical protein [Stylosanthes scabra]